MDEQPFNIGDSIRLVAMVNDPYPIQPGEIGVVTACDWKGINQGWWQVCVDWASGRSLMLSVPPDIAVRVEALWS